MESSNRGRILVVDPDPALRSLMIALLRREGYLAEAAADEDEALRLGRTRQHAAVVVEPRMDGGDTLIDALHAVTGDGKPNVIVVTTPDGHEPSRYLRVPGVRAVLLKPFRLEDLTTAVASCCNGGN